MMKINLISTFITIALSTVILQAQILPKIWYFGENAGVNFNTNPPTKVVDGNHTIDEGGVTITDENGDVLFYADENTLYNRFNQPLKNGTGFVGNSGSSAQSPIAVQDPSNKNLVYIFYVSDHFDPNLIGQIRYSVVDLCGDNGKGEIIENKKNIRIPGKYTERLSAAYNKEGNFFWIIASDFSSQSIKSFKFDSNGISTTPISSSLVDNSSPSYIGMISLSGDLTKLAYTCGLSGGFRGVMLNDFDINTGKISNSNVIYNGDIYDAEFSPSGRFLYITDIFATCQLLKIDLLNQNFPAKQIYSVPGNYGIGSIELGPDNNIYMSNQGLNALSQITNVDMVDEIFKADFLKFSAPQKVNPGLQSKNYFFGIIDESLPFKKLGNDTTICQNTTLILDSGLENSSWNDGSKSRFYDVKQSGTYHYYYRECGKLYTDTIEVNIEPKITKTTYTQLTKCPLKQLTLVSDPLSIWNTGQAGATIDVLTDGIYFAKYLKGCIEQIDSFRVSSFVSEVINLGEDIISCKFENKVIEVPGSFESYLWSTGSTNRVIEITGPGKYWVRAIDSCMQIQTDTFEYKINTETFSDSTELTYYIKPNESVLVGSSSYSNPGIYYQTLSNIFGCDSTLVINIKAVLSLINYDFNKCNAVIGSTNMDYSEFTPIYTSTLDCTDFEASVLKRNNGQENKHSCTPGLNNTLSMCVSSLDDCVYNSSSDKSVIFSLTVNPKLNKFFNLAGVQFYQKAPVNFDWINGENGLNNFPTKYGIRILKNGVEIYISPNNLTSNAWELEQFFFDNNDLFSVTEKTTFTFEILPYCLVGNQSEVSAWDLEDVSLLGYCGDKTSRLLKGSISSISTLPINDIIVHYKTNNENLMTLTNTNGQFTFAKGSVNSEITIKPEKNTDLLEAVSTLDIVMMQRHILGLEKFSFAEQYIAADIDENNKISAFDMVLLRKAILGIIPDFPSNTSWRFVAGDKLDINNPFVFSEELTLAPSLENKLDVLFSGIKIGDVSGQQIVSRSKDFDFKYTSEVKEGFVHFNVYSSKSINDLVGLQLSFINDKNTFLRFSNGQIQIQNSEFSNKNGIVKFCKVFETLTNLTSDKPLFTIVVKVEDDLPISLEFSETNNEYYFGTDVVYIQGVDLVKVDNGFEEQIKFDVFPIPFTSNFTLTVCSLDNNCDAELKLYSTDGLLISNENITLNQGLNEIIYDNQNLPKGTYILRIIANGYSSTIKKIIKM